MNTSGETADQVVRMTLDGVEVLLRISGTGASKLAGFLYAALKDHKKTRGRTRLEAMLKSGKPLEVFSIRKEELRIFTREAKRYGILYCGLKSSLNTDGMCDIMVRSEDAAKINRIVEKLQHGRVDIGSVVSELQQSVPENKLEVADKHDIIVDRIFASANPTMARTSPSPPSEPTSKNSGKLLNGDEKLKSPSVRKELNKIQKEKSSVAPSHQKDKKRKRTKSKSKTK